MSIVFCILGSICIALAIIYLTIYGCVVLAIFRTNELISMPSYKLILALGLSDMGQILVVGLISGLFSVAGQTFNFWLNKISGAILFGNWFFSMTIASILALNRLAAMLELHFLERLFRNRKVLIWLLFVVLYGFSQFIYYMYPNNGVLFYPESCYWFFESDTNYEMSISIGMISDGITIAIMIFCYTSIGVFLKIKRSRTQVHSLKTQEIRALISSLVLSVNAIFLDLMFFIGPIINDDSWMATLNNVLWLICIGNNGIFFIVFNATIRAAVMASFRREATKIIPLKNLTKTQHEIHPSTSGNSKL